MSQIDTILVLLISLIDIKVINEKKQCSNKKDKMKDLLFKTILETVKGVILIVVAGAVLHYVYPKYASRMMKGDVLRFNQVTGQMDRINDDGSWENFSRTNEKTTQ